MGSSTVKDALKIFLKKHNIEDVTGAVDEVLLDYVVSILEELEESGCTEDVDVEGFIEMMEAYIPGFSDIDSVHVSEWMFELAGKSSAKNIQEPTELEISLKPTPTCTQAENSRSCSPKAKQNSLKSNVTGDSGADCVSPIKEDKPKEDDLDPEIKILLEMFPGLCVAEVTHCLMMSSGDADKAVQLLLHRQQTGDTITKTPQKHEDFIKKQPLSPAEEKKMREQFLSRYGYVDEMADKVVHKPITPKQDTKKMVRYLNGRVVSTKGEKFTEIKKEEDTDMKQTYINLKPARKYRFH